MLVIHQLEDVSTANEVDNPCFILTNKIGGYLSFSEKPMSRYQGVFFNCNGEMFKVINSIMPLECSRMTKIKNRYYSVEIGRERLKEIFMMPFFHNSVVYDLSEEKEIEIVLDVKKVYDNREFGRYYKVYEEGDKIIVEFSKETDKREDKSDGKVEYKLYVVINKDSSEFSKTGNFLEEHYPFDERRGSWPWKRYVYSALRIKTKNLIISFSDDKESAIKENNRLQRTLHDIKIKQQIYVNGFQKKIKDKEKMIAYKAACLSLDNLVTNVSNKKGIYAGFWWFFQFWARDEAICLKALIEQGKYDIAKDILFRMLRGIQKDGRIKLFYYPTDIGGESADSIGWVIKRTYDFFEGLYKRKIITDYLSPDEIEFIKNKVESCIYGLIDKHTNDDFEYNKKKETWMDTDYAGDSREGYRIEIQALRLNIYKFMKLLCKVTNDNVGEKIAEKLEKDLAERVRKKFWNRKYLDDGLNDSTIRPNVFIAYYIYPELLSKSQWISCFRAVLPKLWNSWGGLSTIDHSDKLYCNDYTGEDNRSYHRGDSWFWINNLTAICLARLSKFRFGDYVNKIAEASTREILWSGAIGHHAELSSSSMLESQGCFMQAWSAAMYVEMINELF